MAVDAPSSAWDFYWSEGQDPAGALTGAAASEALQRFWAKRLTTMLGANPKARLIDLASGAGVVARQAAQIAKASDASPALYATDYAASVCAALARDVDLNLTGAICADLARAPFRAGSFDAVVSQFGLEYAGQGAFGAAADLVAPGGRLAIVAHMAGGAVHQECAENLEMLRAVLDADILAGARAFLEAVYRLGDYPAPDPSLLERFQAIIHTAQNSHVAAASFIRQVIPDLARLCDRALSYESDEAFGWLDAQDKAVNAYALRMQSMLDAALDEADVERIVGRLNDAAFIHISYSSQALIPEGADAAWIIEAQRQ
jgi:hypothetical protein